MKLVDAIEFNPKEKIIKNMLVKKITMDKLKPYVKYIDKFDYEKYYGGVKFKNGDTIMARITPCLENGKTAYVDILDNNEVAFGSTEFIVMRSKKNITIPEYIYYLSITKLFRDKAISLMNGSSGRQRVQVEALKLEEFNILPINLQVKVTKILSNIDKIIRLNNQINDNLYYIT